MKRLFLSLAFVACLSLTATVGAQNTKRSGQRGIFKELNLTADQQQKMKSANDDFGAKMKELRAKTGLTKEDRQTKMKELRTQHNEAINKVLTPEQQTKWKEAQSKRGNRDNKDNRRQVNGRDKKGSDEKVKAQFGNNNMKGLNLTDDQKQKLKDLNKDFRAKSMALNKQYREDMNKIYTPEQQTKLKDMREKRAGNRKFAFRGGKRMGGKLDEATTAKLKTLKDNYEKEKGAVERSRIAPDAQKAKLTELRNNFRKESRQIMADARKKVQDTKPASK